MEDGTLDQVRAGSCIYTQIDCVIVMSPQAGDQQETDSAVCRKENQFGQTRRSLDPPEHLCSIGWFHVSQIDCHFQFYTYVCSLHLEVAILSMFALYQYSTP